MLSRRRFFSFAAATAAAPAIAAVAAPPKQAIAAPETREALLREFSDEVARYSRHYGGALSAGSHTHTLRVAELPLHTHPLALTGRL